MYAIRFAAFILSIGLIVQPILADEKDPLAHIPFDCNLVVKLSSPDSTVTRIRDILNEASSDLAILADFIPATMEEMLSNPGMTGVQGGPDVWMAVRFRTGQEPELAFLVVASNAKELKEAVGEGFTFFTAGDWTVYSESSELIGLFKKLHDESGRGLNKYVDPFCREILVRGDLAVWIDLQSVLRSYKDEMDNWKSEIQSKIEEIPQNMPNQGNVDPEQITKMYSDFLTTGEKLLGDTRAFCGNVVFANNGVLFDNYVSFAYSSDTVKMLKTLRPSEFKGIGKLPQSHLFYLGTSGFTDKLMQWGLLNSSATVKDASAKQEISKLSDQMIESGLGVMTLSMDVGSSTENLMQTVTQVELDDPQKMRELSHQLTATIGEIDQNGMKIKTELSPEAEEYDGHKADVVEVTFEVPDASSPQGMMQQQVLSSMYGPEGVKTRSLYFEDCLLQVMGSQDFVQEAVDSYLGRPISFKSSSSDNKEAKPSKEEGDSNEQNSETPSETLKGSGLKRRRDDDRRAMFMVDDKADTLLVAQGGKRDEDDDRKGGGGFKIKLGSTEEKPPVDEKSDKEEAPPADAGPPSSIPSDPGETPGGSIQFQIPAFDASALPQVPKRSVTEAIKTARGRLTPKANLLVLVDFPTLIAKLISRFPIVAAFGLPVGEIVKAAEEPSFTGMSLATEGNAFRFRVFIPPTQLKGIGEIVSAVKPLSERFQNGEGFSPPPPPQASGNPVKGTGPDGTPATEPEGTDVAKPTPPPKPLDTRTREERRKVKGKGRD